MTAPGRRSARVGRASAGRMAPATGVELRRRPPGARWRPTGATDARLRRPAAHRLRRRASASAPGVRGSGGMPSEGVEQQADSPVERIRALGEAVVDALDLDADVHVEEHDEEIRAEVEGDELGLLIGRHGVTIDALQHVAGRAAFRDGAPSKRVVVDAAGYRERREAALRRMADEAVDDALSFGRAVELEPMSPSERRIVHMYLRERGEV